MSPIRSISIILALALPLVCKAQIVMVGLPHSKDQQKSEKKSTTSNARTKALALPFWDDFSLTKTSYANPDLWSVNRFIRVNNGMAIRPPSIGVATFDGVDSIGKPYSVNDVLAKGFADNLESKEIDLTTVDPGERNSVYLSFMYQIQGRGEIPDAGDRLQVSFIDNKGAWIPMKVIENDGTLQTNLFYNAVVAVTDERFYHAGFKFRIQNFSRLSGPYDTWNVDYIYLNKGRDENDLSFPDRTISEPLTSLFGIYRTMPISHFLMAPASITKPSVLATNMRANNPQPVNFSTSAKVSYWRNEGPGTRSVVLDNNHKFDTTLFKGRYTVMTADALPDVSDLLTSDSVKVEMTFILDSKDNILFTDPEGDYNPATYEPINFHANDTTRSIYELTNKYAYDDGVAEYGAGLNQPGAQIAYEFNLIGKSQEYITYLEMLFPRFGDESLQVLEIRVWTDSLSDKPAYKEVVTLARTNKFWKKKIVPTAVGKKFYIGWKQTASAVIAVGLDKNTDTGSKMYSNTGGTWVQNTAVHGSLMLRPVFGEGPKELPPSGLEDEKVLTVYPNPGNGVFYFGGTADRITVYDMTGRSTEFLSETTTDETILTLPNASRGIYIIKAVIDGHVRTAKVMIR
ncbi:MAG TPA: T9SS type A sorting domain-containing protein [Cyclobacteriaceae bacterium]|nr:T9SS type A sorting domain-containing protein [Cyclobacteriaceae bacterium]